MPTSRPKHSLRHSWYRVPSLGILALAPIRWSNTHFAGAPTGSEGVSPPQEAAGGRQAGEAARVSPSCVASEEAQFRALSGSRGGAQPTRRSAEHVGSLPPDDNSVRYRRLRRRRRNCNSRRSPRCSRFAHSALRHSFIKASMHRASHGPCDTAANSSCHSLTRPSAISPATCVLMNRLQMTLHIRARFGDGEVEAPPSAPSAAVLNMLSRICANKEVVKEVRL